MTAPKHVTSKRLTISLVTVVWAALPACGEPPEKECTDDSCPPVVINTMSNSATNAATNSTTNNVTPNNSINSNNSTSSNNATNTNSGTNQTSNNGQPDCVEVLDSVLTSQTLSGDCTYRAEGSVTVPQGSTVTVEAGAIVEIAGLYSLTIEGVLDARGSASDPVIFRSDRATPRAGDWGNIYVSGGTLRLDFAEVSHFSGVRAEDSTVQIYDSVVREVRPAKVVDVDTSVFGALDVSWGATLDFERSSLLDVTGETDVGITSIDADGIRVVDSRLERIGGTAFVVSGFGDSTPGPQIEQNVITECGAAGSLFRVGAASVERNEFSDNGSHLSLIREDLGRVDHSLVGNNFRSGSDLELKVEGNIDADASGCFWGSGDASSKVDESGGGQVDTSSPLAAPNPDAGPQ